jgi:hypothetical protein
VDRFHAAGATDNGPPGERAYQTGYYAAYALDPDGNNVEAVYHWPVERSAPSIGPGEYLYAGNEFIVALSPDDRCQPRVVGYTGSVIPPCASGPLLASPDGPQEWKAGAAATASRISTGR